MNKTIIVVKHLHQGLKDDKGLHIRERIHRGRIGLNYLSKFVCT